MQNLTDAQKKRLESHVNAKWKKTVSCQFCGEDDWQLSSGIFEIRPFAWGKMVVGGSVHPVIPVVCSNCGNTALLNAVISGVVLPEERGDAEQQ